MSCYFLSIFYSKNCSESAPTVTPDFVGPNNNKSIKSACFASYRLQFPSSFTASGKKSEFRTG